MNALWSQLVALWNARSLRERLLVGVGTGVLVLLVIQAAIIRPLQDSLDLASNRQQQLEFEVLKAERLAVEALALRGDLERAESEVEAADQTNLFTLIESLAKGAGVSLDSIKPKQGASSPRYKETRAEVSLSGATLEQVTHFLHRIEDAPSHLIVRSLRLKSRASKEATVLDARFSVSSFESI